MTRQPRLLLMIVLCMALILPLVSGGQEPRPGQTPPSQQPGGAPPRPAFREIALPKTPLPPAVLELLANEISGQIAFNNLVKLAGAPWPREDKELQSGFYESETIAALARAAGAQDVRIDRFPRPGEFDYPLEGEFWILKPARRLVARFEADPALLASVPPELDVTGDLIYIPPLTGDRLKQWTDGGLQEAVKGKVALMWSHANSSTAKALDAAGVAGVISFSAQERYFDPDQVLYSRGSYAGFQNLKFGFTVSWRQWSELLEDVSAGQSISVRCLAKTRKYPNRFENVVVTIPGTEPEKKGVIFTAHLFEGFIKRGANDNMSGCAVQLEIVRALVRLIRQGALPPPRRTLVFLWPPEISGTYEQIKQTPGFPDRYSININMDMVGEALRLNNALFTMTECPNHLPSYLDGLTDSLMNYVWRTNDIVYAVDSPRGRPGGQYFPRPLWEKNGSIDAFRYSTHQGTGGSDHVCFISPSVGVPAIELNIWPDQWYHGDTDTPDKADPTQMKRVAFIGAAAAWAAANCADDILGGLLDAVSSFGYARVGKRELPRAVRLINEADAKTLAGASSLALKIVDLAAAREAAAVRSIEDVYSGSPAARRLVAGQLKQWELYRAGLRTMVTNSIAARAAELGLKAPSPARLTDLERQFAAKTVLLSSDVRGKEFSVEGTERYKKYLEKNPEAEKTLKLTMTQRRAVQNHINARTPNPFGALSALAVRDRAEAETGTPIDFQDFVRYLEFLKAIGWVTY